MSNKQKRTSMTLDKAATLLYQYEAWLGNMHPDDHDDYLSEFDSLRKRLIEEGYDPESFADRSKL